MFTENFLKVKLVCNTALHQPNIIHEISKVSGQYIHKFSFQLSALPQNITSSTELFFSSINKGLSIKLK